MATVTVSDKGQVVIPIEIRRLLGIAPGCQLEFSVAGGVIHAQVARAYAPTNAADGYGMLKAKPSKSRTGKRRLADFDVAAAMRAGKS